VALQRAAPVAFHQQGMLSGQAKDPAMHGQETVEQRQGGEVAVRALEPERVGTPGADAGCQVQGPVFLFPISGSSSIFVQDN
jgi:hypothetical protein